MRIMLHFLAISSCLISLLFSQTIPTNRTTDWNTAGYGRLAADASGAPNLPDTYPDPVIDVLAPDLNNNPATNLTSINAAITTAMARGGRQLIQLQAGTYVLNTRLVFGPAHSNITIRGRGTDRDNPANHTILRYESNDTFIQIEGDEDATTHTVSNYDNVSRILTLSTPPTGITQDDYIEIQVPNASHNTFWNFENPDFDPDDFLGQVTQVIANPVSSTLQIRDDFSLVWNLAFAANEFPYVRRFTPVTDFGIEDLIIESAPGQTPVGETAHINFKWTADCWVRGVELNNAVANHILVGSSTALEFRENKIHNAQGYLSTPGPNGVIRGYGIQLGSRSTYCLVEDNEFWRLRHSMMAITSASRNVFGYNYSHDKSVQADLNLHGKYPFFNLFEGNIAEIGYADAEWKWNGPYNTYFRNFSTLSYLKFAESDRTTAVGNEAWLSVELSTDLVDIYGYKNNSPIPNDPVPIEHINWTSGLRNSHYLPEVSLYHTNKPDFLTSSFTWPPIGPPTSPYGPQTSQDLPGRVRFEDGDYMSGYSWGSFTDIPLVGNFNGTDMANDRGDDIAIYRPSNRRWYVSFSGETSFTPSGWSSPWGSADDIPLVGDFNGDDNADRLLFRPSIAKWFVNLTLVPPAFDNSEDWHLNSFGTSTTIPFVADLNNDGMDDIISYDPATSYWRAALSTGSSFDPQPNTPGDWEGQWGSSSVDYIPLMGDFNNDGRADRLLYEVRNGNTQVWHVNYTLDPNIVPGPYFNTTTNDNLHGWRGDHPEGKYTVADIVPIVADFNNDNFDDIASYGNSQNNGPNFFINPSNGADISDASDEIIERWSQRTNDQLLIGDFDANGFDDVLIFRTTEYPNWLTKLFQADYRFYKTDLSDPLNENTTPKQFELKQNYPNPFNPTTTLEYSIPESGYATIRIFNVLGQQVQVLENQFKDAGHYKLQFDGSNLGSGIYFYLLESNGRAQVKKMMLMK